MDPMKNKMSIKCPCLLDDQNYGDWKIHVSMFIKSFGIEEWESIVSGWTIPTKIKNEETMTKPES